MSRATCRCFTRFLYLREFLGVATMIDRCPGTSAYAISEA
jgi:hypothetical protein